MRKTIGTTSALSSLFAVAGLLVAGCGQAQNDTSQSTNQAEGTQNSVSEVASTSDSHDHGGWWCVEHGVPEEDCARCDSSLIASFKAKGDWCEKHDRPESQCFICNPELEAKFAARYEAKFGKKPPKPEPEG